MKLSSTRIRHGFFKTFSFNRCKTPTKYEPRKPAPPVIKTVLSSKYEVDITKTLPHVVAHLMSMRETPTIRRPPTSVLNQELQDLFFASTPIDYIIHAAGLASPVFYRKYPLETIDVTISGTKNLMELACHKNTKSFLLFSSSEIYGDPDPKYVPTPETYRGNVSSIGPRACYDESKRLAETIGMVYYEFYGVPVKIVRPFNVYGPGMKPDDRRVIPAFLSSALSGNPLPVHDRGNQTRTFCYISDAVTGFLQVLISKKGGEVYNVGNDQEEITMKDLARMVKQIMPEQDVQMKLIEYPAGYPADEPQRRCPDLEKIRYELGYHTKINLETGLKRTLKWYQDSFSPTSFEV